MSDIQRLLAIMAQLRDPVGGCPWDVEQNFSSVAPYTIEEAYEVADAIARGDMRALKDELGDLLLQVVFHSRMAQEAEHFEFSDVVDAICDKLIRRHPHVFAVDGSPAAPTARGSASQQLERWEQIKRVERGTTDAPSVLDGVSGGLPEWARASKLQERAAKVGFEWPDPEPVLHKLREEVDEVQAELRRNPRDKQRLTDEIGDVLFVCVNLCRHSAVDFGTALRHANLKFEARFRAIEHFAREQGVALQQLSLLELQAYWDRAKAVERLPE